ncbi:FAD-dependent oxidoreductase [Agrococcus sp. DT81.2]|uniref:FAD-dependent oxidoreductase n=1 Tax=Agrococcus sp. DT81.2 TaxID=3393414 RepID=UPI003CE488C0
MSARHDVAIVGGGAVGLHLACLLAQRGVDVVVLERRTEPSHLSRAIGIHAPGLAALDAAGVGDAVRAAAIRIRSGVALSRGRLLARLPFEHEPILALQQHRTEALLRERLAALAPGALRQGVELVGLASGADDVELAARGTSPVRARWAVGADGVRSTTRALLGIPTGARPGSGGYAMADAPDATGAAATALLHLEPAGIVESFPMPGGQRRWVARLAAPEPGMTTEGLQRILDERLLAPPRLPPLAPTSAFVARQRLADRFALGRVALVGDAAHEVSPIGGQGMSLGWLDALALDRALAAALDGSGEAGAPFAAYERARRPAAERAMRRAWWNMAMGSPASAPRLALRLALVRTLAVPPGRTAVTAAFTMRGL